MRKWLRHLREIRRLEREIRAADIRWRRHYYAYQDMAVVVGFPAALEAMDQSSDALDDLRRLRLELERLETCGP